MATDRPNAGQAARNASTTAEDRVMQTLGDLAAELHAGLRRQLLTLDSSLSRDFGIDSLGRVELIARLERNFQVRLDEDRAIVAQTPRDLLALLASAGIRAPQTPAQPSVPPPRAPAPPLPASSHAGGPAHATTLLETLEWHVEQHPDRLHLRLLHGAESEDLTYRALYDEATVTAGRLRARGISPGDPVALMLETRRAFFTLFFGILLAGGIPVPLYPPARKAALASHLQSQAGILANSGAKLLVLAEAAHAVGNLLRPLSPDLMAIATPTNLAQGPVEPALKHARSQAIALLQYTSGSTGQPKGVILTHANLLANLRALGQAAALTDDDVFVSWLPLYHDMGLIGAWLGSLYFGIPGVLMSPLAFLARPARWLRAISDARATLTAAPNFAYELCARQIPDEDLEGLDLSSLRLAVSGAEPVNPETLARFTSRFAPYGLRPPALAPAYGLAESVVGLTLTPPGRGPRIDRLQREPFLREGQALPAAPSDPAPLAFVSCGRPLPGHAIRIADEDGQACAERQVGKITFSGPSSTPGYYRNPEASRRLRQGDWLDSGDMGYLADGELYVTGRAKDMIIRGGQHLFPESLEEALSGLEGLLPDGVAVFGHADPQLGTERLIVFAETAETRPEALDALRAAIRDRALRALDVAPDAIVFGAPHSAPKTASGKIRRSACRALYARGALGRETPFWRQLVTLRLQGLGMRLARVGSGLRDQLYAAWLWGILGVIVLAGGSFLLLSRDPRRNRRAVRRLARLLLRAGGIGLAVEGEAHLASCRPCVIVANHASYLDSLALAATLPDDVTYTPKRDFTRFRSFAFFMGRLGVRFVDREDVRKGIQDAEQLEASVRQGESVVVFAEGGFSRSNGLRPFHMGAFQVAQRTNAPVLPLGIRGTRQMLPADTWLPRRGSITLAFGHPLPPQGSGWEAMLRLRDETYRRVSALSGEPAVEA